MPALDLLDVRENRIPEAAKIAPAASLPELIILRVRGNPLCDEDAYADAILGKRKKEGCIYKPILVYATRTPTPTRFSVCPTAHSVCAYFRYCTTHSSRGLYI